MKKAITHSTDIEAKLIPAKCAKKKVGFIIQMVKGRGIWHIEGTYRDKKSKVSRGFSLPDGNTMPVILNGQVSFDGFACPICKANDFVQCGRCRGISCWKSGKGKRTLFKEKEATGTAVCAYCGCLLTVSGSIESLDDVSDGKKKS